MKFTIEKTITFTFEPNYETMKKIVAYAQQEGMTLGDALARMANLSVFNSNNVDLSDVGHDGDCFDEEEEITDATYEYWSDDAWDEEDTYDFVTYMVDDLGIDFDDACSMLEIDTEEYGWVENDEDE